MDTCPHCGYHGCSPDCPGPEAWTVCNSCGGSAAVVDGHAECHGCGTRHPEDIGRRP